MRWAYDRRCRWQVAREDMTADEAISNVMLERKDRWRRAAEGMEGFSEGNRDRSDARGESARENRTAVFARGEAWQTSGS